PRALTPEGDLRYSDFCVDRGRSRLVCVMEDHTRGGSEAVNVIAAVPLGGGAPEVLVEGSDFCAAPRVSPDGGRLCWLTWNHPDLPWDGTELWVAELDAAGHPGAPGRGSPGPAGPAPRGEPVRAAGGPRESVLVPAWSPGGVLHLVSDLTGW